jgi:alanyl-tRNA synthetase
MTRGCIQKNDTVVLTVDGEKRKRTALNHTATHILHTALRTVLGSHVKQAGSMVSPERLRFDFSHFSAIDRQTLDAVETIVNEQIRKNIPVSTAEMDAEEAFKTGATALFEEKYGDLVRVVSLADFSKEFCGGTHTERTGDIGLFKIIGDAGIAAGVRRIEALTGPEALVYIQHQLAAAQRTATLVKSPIETLPERVEKIMGDSRKLEKEFQKLKNAVAGKAADDIDQMVKEVNGIKVIAQKVQAEGPAEMRDLADRFKDKLKSGVVVLGAESGGKALLTAIVTKDLTGRIKAGDIVKKTAAIVGGGGGGRPDMAQAGGPNPDKLDEALAAVFELVAGA